MTHYTPPVGLDKLTHFFKSAKKESRLNHAYIFEGPKGIGKKTMAKYFSLILLCDDKTPCLNCKACTLTIANTNPDITIINRDGKASVGIDKIRSLISSSYIKPSIFNKKIFIIDDAHLLTIQAQNALLKILEEPPGDGFFILLCENINFLLPTILSRAVKIKIPPLKNSDLQSISGVKNAVVETYSAGNPGVYKTLLEDEEFNLLRDSFFEKLTLILENDRYKIYDLLEFFDLNKDRKSHLFEMSASFFRDVLFNKTMCDDYIINTDKIKYIENFSDLMTKESCLNVLDVIIKTQNELGKHGAYTLYVHAMLIRCWEEIHG